MENSMGLVTRRRTDAELQQAVLRELHSDSRVAEHGVYARVEDGIVTLSGVVSSWARRYAAQEAAHRVAGVLDVANGIEVDAGDVAGRSDTEIARAVRATLEWDVFVPDQQIRSTVSGGRVTLAGHVALPREREDVEKAVRDLAGVTGVINRIEVVPPPVDSGDLRQAIRAAIQRQAEREARDIELEVNDGCVQLRGVVHSWKEREAVLGAVKGTRGVREIEHVIRIDPYATRAGEI
jgi:osmotically-inducible protein OsmY